MTSEDTFPLTELASMTSRTQKSFPLNENDKIIFDELKELTLSDDWETFLSNLLEFDEFPIDFQDRDGFTLLHHAAFNKSVGCLRVLMEDFFAAPNIKADTGFTPIHLLVSSDCRCMPCMEKILNCLQILIDGGAEVDEEDDLGETALYSAARNRLSQPAGFLLSHGANINHWVNGTSVATLLAQYVPDVLEIEFDKCITSDVKKGAYRSLRLDFRLLLQKVAVDQGLVVLNSPDVERKNKMLSHRRAETSLRGSPGKTRKGKGESDGFLNTKNGNGKQREGSSSTVSSTSTQFSSAIQPKETELLNYLLKADFAAIESVVNHPLVEAFVYLKWLSVRKLFFLLRSSYLFLISLYTFYVFDTFVDATCFYPSNSTSHNDLPTVSGPHQMKVEGRADDNSTAVKATFGLFIPRGASGAGNESRKYYNFYYWHSFAEYFKAHEMTCEPSLRTQIMAYIFSTFVVILVLYELYKLFNDGWRDYFKSPLNLAWWILAVNIGFTVVPGLGIYAHSWHYPYAAFSLVYGWILMLAQLWRMPYFGIIVGVFVKVLKDFILLLLTFSPVLLAFALGFSVMLPQNEFFRSIPTAIFKVFLMMTGDVDFLGVFRGIWTTRQGHVYIPVFIIYSLYILTVTMVLMSLLLGLAVDNIQEVRHEAALHRTVTLIKEIGIFESILHQPTVYYCGLAKYLRRMFSITSLKCMSGPELITFPENSEDTALPPEIKQKLVRYLTASCCCSETTIEHPSYHDISSNKRKGKRYLERTQAKTQGNVLTRNKNREKSATVLSALEVSMGEGADDKKKSKDIIRREFFGRQVSPKTPAATTTPTTVESGSTNLLGNQQLTQQLLQKDLELYKEVKELLEDNDRLKRRLESLKEKLLRRK